ncbi:MAG: ChrR family anti-sigma-E factor [Geminicoccaceae bacterium]
MSAGPELDELLAAHAAGRLPPALGLIVAAHLALAPASRRRYRTYEALGGAFLAELAPAPLASDAWERICRRLDDEDQEPAPATLPAAGDCRRLPAPLRALVPDRLERLPWHRIGAAVQAELAADAAGYRTTLIRVPAGLPYPRHRHRGRELILVLEGGFRDGAACHRRGDLVIAGPEAHHAPVALPEQDWLWLRVLDAPLRRTGPLGPVLDRLRRL